LFFKKARKDIKGYFIGVFDFAVDVILGQEGDAISSIIRFCDAITRVRIF